MKAVVCIASIIAGGRVVLRPIYRRISDLKNAEIFAACTLLVVLGTSVLTQAAGLSLALGAFLVRLPDLVSQNPCIQKALQNSRPLRALALRVAPSWRAPELLHLQRPLRIRNIEPWKLHCCIT